MQQRYALAWSCVHPHIVWVRDDETRGAFYYAAFLGSSFRFAGCFLLEEVAAFRVFGMLGASWLFAFYGAFIGDLRHRVKGQERILGTRRRTRRDGFGLSGCAAALPRAQQPHHYHVKHEARGGVLCTPAREKKKL